MGAILTLFGPLMYIIGITIVFVSSGIAISRSMTECFSTPKANPNAPIAVATVEEEVIQEADI